MTRSPNPLLLLLLPCLLFWGCESPDPRGCALPAGQSATCELPDKPGQCGVYHCDEHGKRTCVPLPGCKASCSPVDLSPALMTSAGSSHDVNATTKDPPEPKCLAGQCAGISMEIVKDHYGGWQWCENTAADRAALCKLDSGAGVLDLVWKVNTPIPDGVVNFWYSEGDAYRRNRVLATSKTSSAKQCRWRGAVTGFEKKHAKAPGLSGCGSSAADGGAAQTLKLQLIHEWMDNTTGTTSGKLDLLSVVYYPPGCRCEDRPCPAGSTCHKYCPKDYAHCPSRVSDSKACISVCKPMGYK